MLDLQGFLQATLLDPETLTLLLGVSWWEGWREWCWAAGRRPFGQRQSTESGQGKLCAWVC